MYNCTFDTCNFPFFSLHFVPKKMLLGVSAFVVFPFPFAVFRFSTVARPAGHLDGFSCDTLRHKSTLSFCSLCLPFVAWWIRIGERIEAQNKRDVADDDRWTGRRSYEDEFMSFLSLAEGGDIRFMRLRRTDGRTDGRIIVKG